MKKINILYFEPSTGYGGSSRCLFQWLQHLNKERFHALVITYYDGPMIKKIKNLGIDIVKLPYISFIKMAALSNRIGKIGSYMVFFIDLIFNILPITLRLVFLIKKKAIGLIDLNSSIVTSIPGILAGKLTNTPLICHIHDTRRLTKIEKYLGKWLDRVIVLTKAASKLYYSELGSTELSVIYNGLNLQEWSCSENIDKIKKDFNLDGNNPIVGIVGRITEGKGHVDFIKAAKIISSSNRKVRFLIVGSAILTNIEIEKQLRKIVHDLNLDENVIFTGWREDVCQVMSIFDILVFPTSTFPEGFGLPCIDAMALEKPVVATDVPGPSEIVLNRVTGFLVPPGNPNKLAGKITTLIDNPELAKSMGIAGRKRVKDLFNIEKLTREIENIYNGVLNKKNRGNIWV